MYKVRFNLGKGKNFQKWQVKSPDGSVEFFEPNEVEVRMFGCFLRNQKGTALKIFGGEDKTVCAWVEADDVIVIERPQMIEDFVSSCEDFIRVSYNPRVTPNWLLKGEDVDGMDTKVIISEGRDLYTLK